MIVTVFLFGCGDLDLALSSGKAYKVNALINGRSLDECAILSNESRISPYFDFNVKGDPDISSLVIYIKDYMGKGIGVRTRYKFPVQDDADTGENIAETGAGTASTTENSDSQAVFSGEGGNGGTTSTTEGGEALKEVGTVSTTTAEVSTEEGEAASVIESGTESVTATEKIPEPLESIISVKNLDDELPDIALNSDTAPGFYRIVFEVIAVNGALLNSVEKPFFYLSDMELTVNGIISYIPGVSLSSGIVPPGEKIMLQAYINASPAIEPYVIWYNGKQQIGEGFVNKGASRIFWSAPAQTGFQDIRVEVFPFDPTKHISTMHGISHTVSLPVSNRSGRDGYYAGREVQMSRWYRLWGTLTDTKDPVSIGALLERADDEEVPLWFPVFSTYGLAVGANDRYKLPDSLFKYVKSGEGSAEILFRFVPWNTAVEKPVLRAELHGKDRDGTERLCVVQLSLLENRLVLQAFCNDQVFETWPSLPLDGIDFVPAAVDFQFFENNIVVSMGLENDKTKSIDAWERLTVNNFVPNGEGSVWFGGRFETEAPEISEASVSSEDSVSAVITEIALLYNEISPALEPVETEESEENLAEKTENTEDQTPEISTEESLPTDDAQIAVSGH